MQTGNFSMMHAIFVIRDMLMLLDTSSLAAITVWADRGSCVVNNLLNTWKVQRWINQILW